MGATQINRRNQTYNTVVIDRCGPAHGPDSTGGSRQAPSGNPLPTYQNRVPVEPEEELRCGLTSRLGCWVVGPFHAARHVYVRWRCTSLCSLRRRCTGRWRSLGLVLRKTVPTGRPSWRASTKPGARSFLSTTATTLMLGSLWSSSTKARPPVPSPIRRIRVIAHPGCCVAGRAAQVHTKSPAPRQHRVAYSSVFTVAAVLEALR